MRFMLMRSLLLSLVVLALGARTAVAVPITFGFTGTITFFEEDYEQPPSELMFDGSIAPGVAFSGEYTFDSDAVGVPSGNPDILLRYFQSGVPFGAHLEVGNYRFDWDNLRITVIDSITDIYDVVGVQDGAIQGPIPPPFSFWGVEMEGRWHDDDGAILSSTQLPLLPPPLSAFEKRELFVLGYIDYSPVQDGNFTIIGTVETLFLVPEPGTALLLGLGLAGLAGVRKRVSA
jgi:hypothetical protein